MTLEQMLRQAMEASEKACDTDTEVAWKEAWELWEEIENQIKFRKTICLFKGTIAQEREARKNSENN